MKRELSKKQKEDFGEAIFNKLCESSFGSISKREFDIFLFNLLHNELDYFQNMSNYEISNILKISETKVKNLILEAGIRYQKTPEDNIALTNIVQGLFDKERKDLIFQVRKDEVWIQIENPNIKRVFEHLIKKEEYIIDYSFSNEILKMKASQFIAFLMEKNSTIKEKITKKITQDFKKDAKFDIEDFNEKTTYEKVKYWFDKNKDTLNFVTNSIGILSGIVL